MDRKRLPIKRHQENATHYFHNTLSDISDRNRERLEEASEICGASVDKIVEKLCNYLPDIVNEELRNWAISHLPEEIPPEAIRDVYYDPNTYGGLTGSYWLSLEEGYVAEDPSRNEYLPTVNIEGDTTEDLECVLSTIVPTWNIPADTDD